MGSLKALRPQGEKDIHIQKVLRRRQVRVIGTESRNNRHSNKITQTLRWRNPDSAAIKRTYVKTLGRALGCLEYI